MIQRKEVQKQPQAQPEERLPHKTAQDGVQRCPVTLRIWPNSFVAGTSNPHRASSSGRSPWSTSTQALTKSPTNSICSFFEHGAPRTSALSSKFLQPIGPNGDMVVSIGLVRRFCWIFGPYKRNLVGGGPSRTDTTREHRSSGIQNTIYLAVLWTAVSRHFRRTTRFSTPAWSVAEPGAVRTIGLLSGRREPRPPRAVVGAAALMPLVSEYNPFTRELCRVE